MGKPYMGNEQRLRFTEECSQLYRPGTQTIFWEQQPQHHLGAC